MAEDRTYRYNKEDGKKTTIIIAALLLAVIIVGGLLLYVISQKGAEAKPPEQNITPPPPPLPANETPENVTPACDDQCLYSQGVSQKNLSACHQISSAPVQQSCYEQLSSSSIEACRLVADEGKKNSCVTAFAVSERDMTICDLLDAEGMEACRNAVDPCFGKDDLCRALQSSDPSRCGTNSTCILDYSTTKKDAASCSLIQNNVLLAACLSIVQDSDKCDDLAKDAEKDYCYQLFAIYTDDYLTCTQITYDTVYAVDCFSAFAVSMQNLSICDNDRLGLDNKWACYTNYALGSGDLSGCQNIHELATTNRFKCSFEYAKKYGNPAACQVIKNLPSRDTCYQGAIIYSNENLNWLYCDDVINFEWMNKCYTEAAKLYDDVTICEKIEADFAEEACVIAYDNYKKQG